MSEIKTEMKTFLVDMICKECNFGRMRPKEIHFAIFPEPKEFLHKCDRCEHEETYLKKYPSTELEFA